MFVVKNYLDFLLFNRVGPRRTSKISLVGKNLQGVTIRSKYFALRTLEIKLKTSLGPAPPPPHQRSQYYNVIGDRTTWGKAPGAYCTRAKGPLFWHSRPDVDFLLQSSAGENRSRPRGWECVGYPPHVGCEEMA
jgi:hypothetical protein